jgi:hypothetical protein
MERLQMKLAPVLGIAMVFHFPAAGLAGWPAPVSDPCL